MAFDIVILRTELGPVVILSFWKQDLTGCENLLSIIYISEVEYILSVLYLFNFCSRRNWEP